MRLALGKMSEGLFLILLLSLAFTSSEPVALAAQGGTTASSNPPFPPGFPGYDNLTKMGNLLVPLILASPQFKLLSHGISFHVKPVGSFGYTWGKGILSTERIILFSADEKAYIVTEVNVIARTIQDMGFANSTQTGVSYNPTTSGIATPNQGGYNGQICGWDWPWGGCGGCCTAISNAGANVQAPSSITLPPGATQACCQFSQWTGVYTTDQYGDVLYLTQGGFAWSGFNQQALPWANSNGFSLFVEEVPSFQNPNPPYYFPAPSFLNGVKGQVLYLQTYGVTDSGCPSGRLDYYQYYAVPPFPSPQATIQQIGICASSNFFGYGDFQFESPGSKGTGSACYNGGYYNSGVYWCQIPVFDGFNSGYTDSVYYSNVQLCYTNSNGGFTCSFINTNANPVQGYYIQHNSEDTGTGAIQNGNYWYEWWTSSN